MKTILAIALAVAVWFPSSVHAQAAAAQSAWICDLRYYETIKRWDYETARLEVRQSYTNWMHDHQGEKMFASHWVNPFRRGSQLPGIKIQGHNRKFERWDAKSGRNGNKWQSYERESFDVMTYTKSGWGIVRTNYIVQETNIWTEFGAGYLGKRITTTGAGVGLESRETTARKVFRCTNLSTNDVLYDFPFWVPVGDKLFFVRKTIRVLRGKTINIEPEARWAFMYSPFPMVVDHIFVSDLPPEPYPARPRKPSIPAVKSGPDSRL